MQIKVACSNFNSAVVGEDGSLFIWGSARSGLLGLGDTIKNQKTPSRMVFPPVEADAISLGVPKHKVVHVSMGPYHIAVLTQNSIFDKIRTDRFMSPILQSIAKRQLKYLQEQEPETYKSMSTLELKDAIWKYEEFIEFIDALQIDDYTPEEYRHLPAFKKYFLDWDEIDPDTNNPKVNVAQYVYELDNLVREEQEAQARVSKDRSAILNELNTPLLSRHIAYVWGLKENGRLGLPDVAATVIVDERRTRMAEDIMRSTTNAANRGGSYIKGLNLKGNDLSSDMKAGRLGGNQALTEQVIKQREHDDDSPEKPDEEDEDIKPKKFDKKGLDAMEIDKDEDEKEEEEERKKARQRFGGVKVELEKNTSKKSVLPRQSKVNDSVNKSNISAIQKTNLTALTQDDAGPKDQEKYSPVKPLYLPGTEITKITCGNAFTVALDASGRVWAWGKGADGCLGNGVLFDLYEPRSPLPSSFFQTQKNPDGKVYDIAAGSQHVLAITKDGTLVSWGKGLHGRLGHGNDMSQLYPTKVNFFTSEKEALRVILIAAGDQHSACVTNKKEIYTWGCGANYRLGHGVNFDELLPRKVTALEDVDTLFISCGSLHTACITNEGSIYAWGSGLNGRLGCETKIGIDAKVPTKVGQLYSDIKKIIFKQVAAGPSHTLGVSERGDLYAWGSYKFHVLGLLDVYQDINVPTKVPGKYYNPELEYEKRQNMLQEGDDDENDFAFAKKTRVNPANIYDLEYQKRILENHKKKILAPGIIRVFCGESNTAFLTEGGDVFITGSGKNGELGINPDDDKQNDDSDEEDRDVIRTKDTFFSMVPRHLVLSATTKFKHLAIGSGHIVGITLSGRAYAWGCNTNSQLGLGKLEKFFFVPQLVEGLSAKDNVMAACGPNFSAVLNQSGEIWVFGTAEYGCLGLIENKLVYDASTPKMINDIEPMKHIACGSQHMASISHDGRIFSWGNGQNGRLGNGTKSTIFKPEEVKVMNGTELVKFKQIGCGRLHTLALDSEGNVWGTGLKQYAGLDFQNDKEMGEVNAFKKIEFRERKRFKHISVGEYHNIALSVPEKEGESGETWGWGKMDYGQLGPENKINITENQSKIGNISGPKKIEVSQQDDDPFGTIEYVAAGVNHSALSTSEGQVFVWGCGLSGRLGISTDEIIELSKHGKIKNEKSVMTLGTPYKINYKFEEDIEKDKPDEIGKERVTTQPYNKKEDGNLSMNQSAISDRRKFDADSALNRSTSSRMSQKKTKGKDPKRSTFANQNDRSERSIRPDNEDEHKRVEEEEEDDEEHLLEGQRLKDLENKQNENMIPLQKYIISEDYRETENSLIAEDNKLEKLFQTFAQKGMQEVLELRKSFNRTLVKTQSLTLASLRNSNLNLKPRKKIMHQVPSFLLQNIQIYETLISFLQFHPCYFERIFRSGAMEKNQLFEFITLIYGNNINNEKAANNLGALLLRFLPEEMNAFAEQGTAVLKMSTVFTKLYELVITMQPNTVRYLEEIAEYIIKNLLVKNVLEELKKEAKELTKIEMEKERARRTNNNAVSVEPGDVLQGVVLNVGLGESNALSLGKNKSNQRASSPSKKTAFKPEQGAEEKSPSPVGIGMGALSLSKPSFFNNLNLGKAIQDAELKAVEDQKFAEILDDLLRNALNLDEHTVAGKEITNEAEKLKAKTIKIQRLFTVLRSTVFFIKEGFKKVDFMQKMKISNLIRFLNKRILDAYIQSMGDQKNFEDVQRDSKLYVEKMNIWKKKGQVIVVDLFFSKLSEVIINFKDHGIRTPKEAEPLLTYKNLFTLANVISKYFSKEIVSGEPEFNDINDYIRTFSKRSEEIDVFYENLSSQVEYYDITIKSIEALVSDMQYTKDEYLNTMSVRNIMILHNFFAKALPERPERICLQGEQDPIYIMMKALGFETIEVDAYPYEILQHKLNLRIQPVITSSYLESKNSGLYRCTRCSLIMPQFLLYSDNLPSLRSWKCGLCNFENPWDSFKCKYGGECPGIIPEKFYRDNAVFLKFYPILKKPPEVLDYLRMLKNCDKIPQDQDPYEFLKKLRDDYKKKGEQDEYIMVIDAMEKLIKSEDDLAKDLDFGRPNTKPSAIYDTFKRYGISRKAEKDLLKNLNHILTLEYSVKADHRKYLDQLQRNIEQIFEIQKLTEKKIAQKEDELKAMCTRTIILKNKQNGFIRHTRNNDEKINIGANERILKPLDDFPKPFGIYRSADMISKKILKSFTLHDQKKITKIVRNLIFYVMATDEGGVIIKVVYLEDSWMNLLVKCAPWFMNEVGLDEFEITSERLLELRRTSTNKSIVTFRYATFNIKEFVGMINDVLVKNICNKLEMKENS